MVKVKPLQERALATTDPENPSFNLHLSNAVNE